MSKPGLLLKALRTIQLQRKALDVQQETIDGLRQINDVLHTAIDLQKRQVLDERRERLALMEAWRIAIERPEVDLRDEIEAGINQLRDEVAVIEEQLA